MKSVAELVDLRRFTIPLGQVVLLAVFLEAMAAGFRAAVFGEVVRLGRAFGFFAPVEPFDECPMGLFAVFTFGVGLRGFLATVRFSHLLLLIGR